MAVPKSKVSKQRRDKRRANWKLAAPAVQNWDVRRVTNMDSMFNNCHSFEELDLSA